MNLVLWVLVALGWLMPLAANGATPNHATRILQQSVSNLKAMGGVKCSFTIEAGSKSANGVYVSQGRKFTLQTPGLKTWFDGRQMWTLNESSSEVTLVIPDNREIRETNPFSYLDSYQSGFNVLMSQKTKPGVHLVLLNPKPGTKGGVKAIEIGINKRTLLPEHLILRDSNDRITTVKVDAIKKEVAAESSFRFDEKKNPGTTVVDLR